ncbi:MBL fold metallo-hydrolase [Maricaulaceae bacterium MS644]
MSGQAGEGAVLRALILGCGSSGGVPRIDGDWGACDPGEPKNRRRRCSLLLERSVSLEALDTGHATRVLIDTSPDLREQMLAARSPQIHAVAFTHTHADQCHGIDDVRALVYQRRERLPAIMSAATRRDLLARFGYIFETPAGSGYPPLLISRELASGDFTSIEGPGGSLKIRLFDVEHGGAACSGVRAGPLAYTPDVNGLGDAAFEAIAGSGVWIVDALRERPHPSHAHLDQSLEWLSRVQPSLGVLTNLHIDLDYRALLPRLPRGVRPAYDGLSVTMSEATGAVIRADPV